MMFTKALVPFRQEADGRRESRLGVMRLCFYL